MMKRIELFKPREKIHDWASEKIKTKFDIVKYFLFHFPIKQFKQKQKQNRQMEEKYYS